MIIKLHKNARTTPASRRHIQESPRTPAELSRELGVHEKTVRRWKGRQGVEDRSSRPHKMQTTLTELQERVAVELRVTLLLSLDDLLAVVREFLNPGCSRAGLDRCLRRHGVSNLKALLPPKEKRPHKSFKDYLPGYLHADLKELPLLPGESRKQYLYVAIDRATRWVYFEVLPDKQARTAAGFLDRVKERCPMNIYKLLTDNGKEFTDRFCAAGERIPTGRHPFDQVCARHGIEHRLITPRRPQTNGMVERFNGRVAGELRRSRFRTYKELGRALQGYRNAYLAFIPQKALGHKTPLAKLHDYYKTHSQCFWKPPPNLPRPDTYSSSYSLS